ncbi:MFS transporter [Oceanobacillus sp. CAU 1775]
MSTKESTTPLKLLLFSFHAGNTILISFLPVYLKYRGLSGSEIGMVLAVGPLASIFGQPFWGYLSDKYKTIKWILLVCVLGLLVWSTVFFQMKTLIPILIVGAIFYFFITSIGGLGDSMAQRRADELSISFGSIRTWGSIGFAISSLTIGILLNVIGVRFIYWPYLFFGIMLLIIILKLKDVKVDNTPIQLTDVKKLIMNKPLVIFLVLMSFLTISHRANDSFLGIFIVELGGSESLVGIAWFVGLVAEAIVFATAVKWFQKFRMLTFVILAGVIYSVRWVLYAFVTDPLLIVGLQFMHGLSFGVFYVASFAYITRLIPKLLQSTGHLFFYSIFFGVSGIIGSLFGGQIIDIYNGSMLYLVMAALSVIGVILLSIYHFVFKPEQKMDKIKESMQ